MTEGCVHGDGVGQKEETSGASSKLDQFYGLVRGFFGPEKLCIRTDHPLNVSDSQCCVLSPLSSLGTHSPWAVSSTHILQAVSPGTTFSEATNLDIWQSLLRWPQTLKPNGPN